MTWIRRCGIAALVFTAWAAGTVAAQAEKRVALVIGNSNYEHAVRLPNPVNDGAAIARLLKATGFDTLELRHDLGVVTFKRALREFTLAAQDADIAVIFFAGHGIEVGGTNYLLPVDAKLASDIDAEDEAVSLDRMLRAMEPARRLRLVILDACRDNPFLRNMRRTATTRSVNRGLTKVEPMTADTLVAFAAKAGSTAEDGGGPNSPFTAALLKHLAEPGLDLQLAFRRVRDDVLKVTHRKQEPYVYGSLGGDTIALVPPVPVVAAPPPPRPDELTWDILKNSSDVGAIRRFIAQFPASTLRTPAEQRIAALIEIEKRRSEQAERDRQAAEHAAREQAKSRADAERRAREEADKREAERRARETAEPRKAGPDRPDDAASKRAADPPADAETRTATADRRAERGPADTPATPAPEGPAPEARIAALPSGPATAPAAPAPPPTGQVLAREIKKELARVGCYSGPVDDSWPNRRTDDSLKKFARHARVAPAAVGLTTDTLDILRRHPARLCPLECASGEVEKDGKCVAKPCPPGQRAGNDGKCISASARKSSGNRSAAPKVGRKCFAFGGKNYCE